MHFLCFNEAALLPLADPGDKTFEYRRLETYIKTYKVFNEKGFKIIRYDRPLYKVFIAEGRSLKDCIEEGVNSESYRLFATFLLSTFHYPFIDDDSREEEIFVQNYFHVIMNDDIRPVTGLAAAFLYSAPAIHFISLDNFWNRITYDLMITGGEGEERIEQVISISKPTDFENIEYSQWEEGNRNIELIECNLLPGEKSISLRDDHGKDVLEAFSKIIVRSPYVIEIINSIPFNPYQRKFIKNVSNDGKIEIVLTHTDSGLGLVLQTTGRNYRETEKIAQILNLKYARWK